MLLMYCFSELTMSNNLLETESLAVKHRQFLITSKHLIDCIFCAAIYLTEIVLIVILYYVYVSFQCMMLISM